MGAREHGRWWFRSRPVVARLVLLGRMIVVLACLHLSGVAHAVSDCLVAFDVISEHCDDCEDEPPGDCPPGCPSCHCGVASLPPSGIVAVLAAPTTSEASPITNPFRAPVAPSLATLYRPPRHAAVSIS